MKDSVNNEAETPAVPEEAPALARDNTVDVASRVQPAPAPVDQPSSQPVPVIMQKQQAQPAPTAGDVPPKPASGNGSASPAHANAGEFSAPASQPRPVPASTSPQSDPNPPVTTLPNDAILASPTPLDSDPPPLVDVPPLSAVAPASGDSTTLTPIEPEPDLDSHLPPPRPQADFPNQDTAQQPVISSTLQPIASQPPQEKGAAEPPPKPAPNQALKPISDSPPQPSEGLQLQTVSEPQAGTAPPQPTANPQDTGAPSLSKPEPYAETEPEVAAKAEASGNPEPGKPEPESLPEVAPISLKPLSATAADGLSLARNEMEIPLPESEESESDGKSKQPETKAESSKSHVVPAAEVPPKQEAPSSGDKSVLPNLLTPVPAKTSPGPDKDDPPGKAETKNVSPPKKSDSIDDIIQELTSKTTLKAPTKRTPRKKGESKLENYVKNEFFVSEGAEDPWILPAAAAAEVAANHKKRSTGESGKAGAWGMFTSIFFFGAIFILGALAMTWMMRGTIASKIEASANRKIEEAGYFISYNDWKYDPVRGIVLNDVTVFESDAKTVPHAKVDNIGFNTDFLTIFRTKDIAGLKKTVSFRDSNLILFDQNEIVANFSRLRGTLELSPGLADLENLKGRIEGIRFDVGGAIRFPETREKEVARWSAKPEASSIATSEPGTNPSGSIIIQDDVALDPTSPDSKPSKSEMLRPSFAPRDDISAPRAIPVFPEESKTTEKTEPPVEETEAKPSQSEPPVISPPVSSPPVASPPVASPPVASPPVISPPVASPPVTSPPIPAPPIAPPPIDPPAVEDEAPKTTEVESADPKTASSSEPLTPGPASTNSNSRKINGLLSLAFLRDTIPLLRVKSQGPAPVLTSRFEIDLDPGNKKILADGRLTGSQIAFRNSPLEGIPFHSVDVPFSYDHTEGILTLPEISISHDEGTVTGNFGIHLKKKLLSLQNVRSTIDWLAFINQIKPDLKENFKNFRFLDAPEIFIPNGQVPWENPMAGQVDFTYEQWAGLVWTIGGKSLPVREIRGSGKLSNSLVSMDALHAKVLDGPTFIEGNLKLEKPDYPFNGSINVRAMPVASLAKFAGIEGKYLNGLLNLDYQGSISSSIARMGGTGAVELKDAQLYKVPVIGPIQRLLGAAIPVFGPKNNSAVTGNFIIDSGVLMTSDLLVRSDGTKVAVDGQADLTQLMTNFTATANLDGPLGIATGLTGEKIELEGRGPLKSPVIRLKGGALPAGFSSETVKGILEIADGSNEAMSAMMQEIAAGSGGAMGALLKRVTGEANRTKPATDPATEVLRGVVVPVATPATPPPPESRTPTGSRAGDILNSVRKSQEGLQGILQKTR